MFYFVHLSFFKFKVFYYVRLLSDRTFPTDRVEMDSTFFSQRERSGVLLLRNSALCCTLRVPICLAESGLIMTVKPCQRESESSLSENFSAENYHYFRKYSQKLFPKNFTLRIFPEKIIVCHIPEMFGHLPKPCKLEK